MQRAMILILAIGVVALPIECLAQVLTQPAGVKRQPILDEDARLRKEVTLRLKRSPLAAVVEEIGRQVGVTLTAAPDVADEPAIVYVTDQPANSVMQHLATLFNFRWTRKGAADRYAYEIYQDLKSRQEEESLRQSDRLRALEALDAALRERLILLARSAEELLREAELSQRGAGDGTGQPTPVGQQESVAVALIREGQRHRLREGADPLQRVILTLVGALTPAQWGSLKDGVTLHFGTNREPGVIPLEPALAARLRAAPVSLASPTIKPRFDSPESEARFRQTERAQQQDWQRAAQIRLTVWLALTPRRFSAIDITRDSLDLPAREATLSVVPSAVAPHSSNPRGPQPFGLRISSQETLLAQPPAPAEPEPTPGTDGKLGETRRFELDLKPVGGVQGVLRLVRLTDLLPEIATTFEINLIADAYQSYRYAPPEATAAKERSLAQVLNQYVWPSARWSKQGAFIHVRRRNWYWDRIADIPDRVLGPWWDRVRSAGKVSLEDAAWLAAQLREEQAAALPAALLANGMRLRNNRGEAERFGSDFDQCREMLRAYTRLSASQQGALREGRSIPWMALSPAARQHVEAAMESRQRPALDPKDRRPVQPAAGIPLGHDAAVALSLVSFSDPAPAAAPARVSRVGFLVQSTDRSLGQWFGLELPLVDRASRPPQKPGR